MSYNITMNYYDGSTYQELYPTVNLSSNVTGNLSLSGSYITGVLPVSKGGTGFTSLSSLASDLNITKAAFGSYTGTGTYGSSHQNSLSFSFYPRVLFIDTQRRGVFGIFTRTGQNTYFIPSASNETLSFTWSNTRVQWYTHDSEYTQLNENNTTYHYFCLGTPS